MATPNIDQMQLELVDAIDRGEQMISILASVHPENITPKLYSDLRDAVTTFIRSTSQFNREFIRLFDEQRKVGDRMQALAKKWGVDLNNPLGGES